MAKTILEALNELVEKQGGNTEDNKLIVDALNDLVESSGGSSGGGLPLIECQFVEETDNSSVFQITSSNYTEGNPLVVLKFLASEEEEEDEYMVAEITNSTEMRTIPHIAQTGNNQIKINTTTFQTLNGLDVGAYIQMFYNEFYVNVTSGSPN